MLLNLDVYMNRLNDAIKFHQEGRMDQAATIYQAILDEDPDNADALHFLGLICFQKGADDRALELMTKALAIRKDRSHFYSNLGAVFFKKGMMNKAVAAYKKALKLNPNATDIHANLGETFLKLGQFQKAASCFGNVAKLNPGNPEILNKLGNTLNDAGKHESARAIVEQAVRIKPDFAEAYNNLGNILIALGETDAAIKNLEAAIRYKPDLALAYHNLGKLAQQGLYTFDEARIQKMKVLVKALPPKESCTLCFTLGAVMEKKGRYDEAFFHIKTGNNIQEAIYRRQKTRYNAKAHQRQTDAIIKTLTRDFFETAENSGIDSDLPVFIIGLPRSGTTLVEQILSSHPSVFGAGELTAMKTLADTLTPELKQINYPQTLVKADQNALRQTAENHLKTLKVMGRGAVRVVDKMYHNFTYLGFIRLLFPKARIIHCRRNRLDVALSCYFQHFSQIRYATTLENIGGFIREYERLMDHWNSLDLPVRIYEVRYEELVNTPEKVSRELIDFMDLEWDKRCLEFYLNRRGVKTSSQVQVRKPIYRSSVKRWERYRQYLEPLMDALN